MRTYMYTCNISCLMLSCYILLAILCFAYSSIQVLLGIFTYLPPIFLHIFTNIQTWLHVTQFHPRGFTSRLLVYNVQMSITYFINSSSWTLWDGSIPTNTSNKLPLWQTCCSFISCIFVCFGHWFYCRFQSIHIYRLYLLPVLGFDVVTFILYAYIVFALCFQLSSIW